MLVSSLSGNRVASLAALSTSSLWRASIRVMVVVNILLAISVYNSGMFIAFCGFYVAVITLGVTEDCACSGLLIIRES